MRRQENDTGGGMAMKGNLHRIDGAGEARIVATFGHAQLVRHNNGRYELRGGSVADHTDATEWISLFLHEAVVSLPLPVAGRRRLSGFTRFVSRAAVGWVALILTTLWLLSLASHFTMGGFLYLLLAIAFVLVLLNFPLGGKRPENVSAIRLKTAESGNSVISDFTGRKISHKDSITAAIHRVPSGHTQSL